MSQENVETVNAGCEAWIRGDLNAYFELCDPSVEWDTTNYEGWPEDDVYSGRKGVHRFLEEWRASWEQYEAGVEEYLDIDSERVLVLWWQRGVGRGSHIPVKMDWALICTLKRGLVRRMEAFSDRREALKAVGLED
jgi:ketosteroid isomerase-like protein